MYYTAVSDANGTVYTTNIGTQQISIDVPSGSAGFIIRNEGRSEVYANKITFSDEAGRQPGLSKQLGANAIGSCPCGDPIDIGSGNLYETAQDYATVGANPLAFMRYYNSLSAAPPRSLGKNWRSTYDRHLRLGATTVIAERADGRELTFTLSGNAWAADSDVDLTLTHSGTTWTLIDGDDTVETYSAIDAATAVPTVIRTRNGYTQSLSYDADHQLRGASDSFHRKLAFTYAGGLLQTLTPPDGPLLTYGYTASTTGGPLDRLASVTYSTNPATKQSYVYENASFPFALTGLIDENGQRFTSWSYDTKGRATSSQHAGGADLTTIAYDDNTGSRTVTNALGLKETYSFATLQGVPKVTTISRLATATTPAATRSFAYDTRGYLARQTDWRGVVTTYVNDARGQPTQITEAAGTSLARVTGTTWSSALHLPVKIVAPGLTTDFTYDSAGEPITRTETASSGARSWKYGWSNHLLSLIDGPRTDVSDRTQFGYDTSGRLTSITNALGQVTKITASTAGGRPLTIVDPNGVTTTLAYDARLRLASSSLATSGGARVTRFDHDAAGNLLRTTLPDGSLTATTYDAAHRPVRTANAIDQRIATSLDALGDPTSAAIQTAGGAATVRQAFSTFDALGRAIAVKQGAGQLTGLAYDAAGNVVKITDPLKRITSRTIDALGRVTQVTDPAGGVTKFTYDAQDRLTSLTAPNGAVTTYSRDGFGRVTQRVSPDTGTTRYYYDSADNLIETDDAAGIRTLHSYDALNRVTSTSYPADTTQNVTFRYDETGHGFGIGRLTGLTDAVGSLSMSYDERGLETRETRTHGAVTLTTGYGYNAAGRLAQIAYPSGTKANYSYSSTSLINNLTVLAPGGTATGSLAVGHQPFGPVNAMTYGNGIAETRSYDADYRLTKLKSDVQALTYGYDAADNIKSITDGISAANSEAFGYDALDHLTDATGLYGSRAWSYDGSGNRLSESAGGPTGATYSYLAKSNRLTGITAGGATTSFAHTASGNLAAITPPTGAAQALSYTPGQRLAGVTSGATQLGRYHYDAFGRRFDKATTTTRLFQHDQDGRLLEEADVYGHPLIDTIYLDGMPVARIAPQTGALSYIHTDHLGTPQLATSPSKSLAWGANYEPFGGLTAKPSGAITQNLRLPGQYADSETGYYQNGFRDYAPLWGRYLESDPIGLAGGVNTYGYVGGNPTSRVDQQGLCIDPGGSGIRYCIEEYIPKSRAWGFEGDQRGPTANGGTFRSQQLIWNNDNGQVESSTDPGVSHIFGMSARGNQGPHSVSKFCEDNGSSIIRAMNHTSNGFLPGIAPYAWYDFTIIEHNGNASVSGIISPFPNVEIWQYGNGEPKLIMNYKHGRNTPVNIGSAPVTVP